MRVSRRCALCESAAFGQGEHVWPKWFTKRWKDKGPFTLRRNGETDRDRSGKVRTTDHVVPDLLPACKACNTWLNEVFEDPAKEAVRAFLRGEEVGPEPAAACVAWFVKTLLLTTHPAVESPHPARTDGALLDAWEIPQAYFAAMRQGLGFPTDLTLWAARSDPSREPLAVPEDQLRRLHLGSALLDGVVRSANGAQYGIPTESDSSTVELTLLWHPSCDVEHPMELSSEIVRLWPWVGGGLSLRAIPLLDPRAHYRLLHTFVLGSGPMLLDGQRFLLSTDNAVGQIAAE